MKKLLTLDLDGTLLDHENEIIGGTATVALLKKFQEAGVALVINTGRLDHDIACAAEKMGLALEAQVSQNGAVIVQNAQMRASQLDKKEACALWQYLKKQEQVRVELNTVSNRYWLKDRPAGAIQELYPSQRIVADYEPVLKHQPAVLFMIVSRKKEQLEQIQAYVKARFDHLHPLLTSASSLEIIPAGVSKGTAMRQLYPADFLIAVGDSENDFPVFEVADIAYCVGNKEHPRAVSAKNIVEALELSAKNLLGTEAKKAGEPL